MNDEQTFPRLLAVPVAAAYAGLVWAKIDDGVAGELWWMCHVATLVLIAGLALRDVGLVAVGTLVHLSPGVYVYLIDAVLRGETTATSFFSHLASPAVGLYAVFRVGGYPRWALAGALGIALVSSMGGYFFAEPDLNVNQTHTAWIPGDPRRGAVLYLSNAVLLAVLLGLSDGLLRRLLDWRKARAWRTRP